MSQHMREPNYRPIRRTVQLYWREIESAVQKHLFSEQCAAT